MKIQKQISQKAYKPSGFIGKYQELIRNVVIPYQYDVISDKAENTEKSHVIANFINAGKALRGEETGDGYYGMVFQDSDAAKWIEAAAYSLALKSDIELEKKVDELIDIIAGAQDKDGYLDTAFTVKDRERRWQNLLEGHELYCAGHMIEAACAYYEATGKSKLLNVMKRCADHIYSVFIENGHEGAPGHPEVELALMKLFRVTGNERYKELAAHFIDTRGTDPHYYEREVAARDWTVWGNNASDNNYQQSGKPVREQSDATGHAVRAVYLYTGMADMASYGDEALFDACKRLWRSITEKQMYITGGIGSTVHGEAFSTDYDLPNDTAYCETCASIGLMFFASRMLENEVNGVYADVMERAFYNTVLAGMQLDGKRFFYVNPLECLPNISGKIQTHRHDLTERPSWYACACCPPNTARLISSFGKYAYGENEDTAYCHLFAAGDISLANGMKISCETGYPYDFTVKYIINDGAGKLAVRIPAWSSENNIEKNGKTVGYTIEKGYIYIEVSRGDEITLTLSDKPYSVYGNIKVPELTGKKAICRGPLVYCFEGADNDSDVISLMLLENENAEAFPVNDEKLGAVVKLKADAIRTKSAEGLYTSIKPTKDRVKAVAVPYYMWANRGENQMRVWLPET